MKKFTYLIAVFVFVAAIPPSQGCSSQQTTTQTAPDPNHPGAATTTTTTTTDNEPDSVLGSTLHAVGTVILLPFRLVGDALGLIF